MCHFHNIFHLTQYGKKFRHDVQLSTLLNYFISTYSNHFIEMNLTIRGSDGRVARLLGDLMWGRLILWHSVVFPCSNLWYPPKDVYIWTILYDALYHRYSYNHLQYLINTFILRARKWGWVVGLLRNTRGGHQLCYDLLYEGRRGQKRSQNVT